jgi:hypothetical protein
MLRLQTARSAVNKVVPSTTYTVRTMTAFSQMSDNDPKVLEKEKQKHLQKEKEKKWNEKLASQSEAAVSFFAYDIRYTTRIRVLNGFML